MNAVGPFLRIQKPPWSG